MLQVPDVQANNNKEELYVTAIDGPSPTNLSPLASSQRIAAVRWLPDGKSLSLLVRRSGKIVLARLELATKTEKIIWEADNDITDYSMDATGETIAIAARLAHSGQPSSQAHKDSDKGYRVDLASTARSERPRRIAVILRRGDKNQWHVAQKVEFVSPLTGRLVSDITENASLHINLSPDGLYLVLDNVENFSDVPKDGIWGSSPIVNNMRNTGLEGVVVSYLYDLSTKSASIPLKSPLVRSISWAPDSKSFLAVALAPAQSTWEASDVTKGSLNDHITHMFSIDMRTNSVTEVLERAEKPPIAWTGTDHILLRSADGRLTQLRNVNGQWIRERSMQIPIDDLSPYSALTSDGHRVVVEYENARTSPEIIVFDPSTNETKIVARLDPQMDKFLLPKSEVVTWTTSTGYKAKGLLLLPPDYDSSRRYPIVIENGSLLYHGQFVCDSGIDHVSSWPRGILADDGILYLMRFWPGITDWESNYYPKGLPGSLAEVAFKQDLVESAIEMLDQRQVIDLQKVGLVGFSRGGWYVEYALAHSRFPFRAASATDNVLYSTGEYWMSHNQTEFRAHEGLYGGPPYGDTLKNWLDYSISFNLDKVHTPLLTEVMGYGKQDNDPDRPPDNLAIHEELLVGLSRLHRPVEFYYYPNEKHQPEHPQARIASLHRNIDWFRFWLQGYETPTPQEADQYKRWEQLRNDILVGQSGGGLRKH
ncbi:prolyl oligopeptidase family serine peptidase [Acidicapsa ligni]|uniref:prolyl oligopeptidase family serine peptidase n=1 Tax=Acidicapsa ligni TaxID=542300 RepID=UPI0021DF5C86|nr:prolyl oligopeptidase family serine peptidase [Acidicapsa ligni]